MTEFLQVAGLHMLGIGPLGKYASELHANEIMLLAYYITAVNIEATFHGVHGSDYQPFEGIVLTDTFQISEEDDVADLDLFPQNNARIERQQKSPFMSHFNAYRPGHGFARNRMHQNSCSKH
ncbi:hypothetical protein [Hoyosella subflava]|uniref:Type III restriction protein res subunit n=1 Tax=Hoyosella subflava (strain DSM 45089 / JCM 17490 / NBRC 109087 / DQS3-9A1) TaxID=443218 RepID=F6ESL9_HOYSD|nr:hypothetical protein [Hoyosella subflava]AEF43140.1 Type III restriction protein res subunit [Hoyosella subflava DQS3-9A1]